jgi:hypothetical protein
MTPARATVYIGGAVVLAAWLASAASTRFAPDEPQPAPRVVATSGTERLAADVQAQSARLRERMAAAPVPQQPRRNPFEFGERELPRARPAALRAPVLPAPDPVPVPAREPELALAGIAEQQSATGIVRTAVIVGAGDEIFMVTEGQSLIGRYTVTAVGPDVVELKDSTTGSTRRLALR